MALSAGARLGLQLGEAVDRTPQVAVFEALPDEQGACMDTQVGRRGGGVLDAVLATGSGWGS